MAFFDTVKELGAKGADKAKELGELGKLKLQITEAEGGIKKLYEEVAKDLFENKQDFLQANYPEQFEKLADFRATIDELKAKIESIKAD